MTESDPNRLSTFHTKNPRRILRIFWPDTISNQHPRQHGAPSSCEGDGDESDMWWEESQQHLLRSPSLTLKVKRKRRRPKNTWLRPVERELKTLYHTWGTLQKLAKSRQEWGYLHASRHNGHEKVRLHTPSTLKVKLFDEQGWRSVPPIWPRFTSWTKRHKWIEFVLGSHPCWENFLSGEK